MLFLNHYNNSYITCTNEQLDKLVYTTRTLFKIYTKDIFEHEILDVIFYNDDIFYSAKYLFKSKKTIEELHPNYCYLAKLIYIHYCGNKYPMELDCIVSSMCIDNIASEMIYTEYY